MNRTIEKAYGNIVKIFPGKTRSNLMEYKEGGIYGAVIALIVTFIGHMNYLPILNDAYLFLLEQMTKLTTNVPDYGETLAIVLVYAIVGLIGLIIGAYIDKHWN